jgi:hypothetical protein
MPRKKTAKKDSCEMNGNCTCGWFLVKLTAMAFILFLLTVWPGFRTALLSLHWGWYLGITLVLGAALAVKKNCCWCCKK